MGKGRVVGGETDSSVDDIAKVLRGFDLVFFRFVLMKEGKIGEGGFVLYWEDISVDGWWRYKTNTELFE